MTGDADATLAVHATMSSSRANGPGHRAVIWVQGCDLGCPGCYNPQTHGEGGGERRTVASLVDWLEGLGAGIEGVSISGGEPLQQRALGALLGELRRRLPDLSILIFSGYSLAEVRARPDGDALLASIDVLIDGRYVNKLHRGSSLRGSENQSIHCLTDRYTVAEVEATPATEVSIGPDGSIVLTGVSPLDI